jgi:ornithine carbamoyltransferase
MIVAYPRLGINLQIATPGGEKYSIDKRVLDAFKSGYESERGSGKMLVSTKPEEAVAKADVIVTDTWISMGQEAEKQQRLKDFAGFQVTEKLASAAGANKDWKFLHCLPRKEEEVDDEVFYGPRSVVFQEAENRKWSALATFDAVYGRWKV